MLSTLELDLRCDEVLQIDTHLFDRTIFQTFARPQTLGPESMDELAESDLASRAIRKMTTSEAIGGSLKLRINTIAEQGPDLATLVVQLF